MNPTMIKIILYVYSALYFLCFGVLRFISLFRKDWREHLHLRSAAIKYFSQNPAEGVELFFCSSAGEYEQCLPLIHAMEPDRKVVILFFSPSGMKYARKRKEHRPYFLAPFDFTSDWKKLFAHLKVNNVFVIRHELWPNFLNVASQNATVHLVDASIQTQSISYKFLYRFSSAFIKHIYAVSLYDYNVLKFLCKSSAVELTGDTKYDRVAERKEMSKERIARYKSRLEKHFPGKNYLIIGSAWPKDTEIILQSLRLLPAELASKWRVFIAPHDLSESMLELQRELARRYGFILKSYDEFKKGQADSAEIILVDKLGILFELYGGFDLAFVGGALHAKIHNVLEPAIFGVELGFGPRYKNQKEAKFIAEKELAEVIITADAGAKWIEKFSHEKPEENKQLLKYIDSLMGATKHIVKTL